MAVSIIDREAASRLGLFSRLGSNSVQNRHFALSDGAGQFLILRSLHGNKLLLITNVVSVPVRYTRIRSKIREVYRDRGALGRLITHEKPRRSFLRTAFRQTYLPEIFVGRCKSTDHAQVP